MAGGGRAVCLDDQGGSLMKVLWIGLLAGSWWCYPQAGRWHCIPIVTALQDGLELAAPGPEILPPDLDFADGKGIVHVVSDCRHGDRKEGKNENQ
jgi:hypothetical protein